jgi:hypothetical protein
MMLTGKIAALEDKPMKELQNIWELYFNEPPISKNKEFLVSRIAYRMQELFYGGLSRETEKDLSLMVKDIANNKPARERTSAIPVAGTKIIREYRGIEYQITIKPDGFEFQGLTYKNLTIVAEKITGTHTSGPAFFGLRKGNKRNERD